MQAAMCSTLSCIPHCHSLGDYQSIVVPLSSQEKKQYKQNPTQTNPIMETGGNSNVSPVLDYVSILKYAFVCMTTVSLSYEEIPERVSIHGCNVHSQQEQVKPTVV